MQGLRGPHSSRTQIVDFLIGTLARYGIGWGLVEGSWRAGDFHWPPPMSGPLSDLDLLDRERSVDSNALISLEVALKGVVSHVAYRTVTQYPTAISVDSSNLVSLADLASYFRPRRSHPQQRQDYEIAKTLLMVRRRHFSERAEDIARSLGTESGWNAWKAKTGRLDCLSGTDQLRLLASAPRSVREELDAIVTTRSCDDVMVREIIKRLFASTDLSSEVRETMIDRLQMGRTNGPRFRRSVRDD